MKALILAAGKGTRLKELTRDRPKPMLPIGDMPLLAHHIRWLREYGVTEVAMNLHHAPEVITGYFGSDEFSSGEEYDVAIHYSYEATLLGTAGAAKRLQDFLDQTFVVVYGDVFTNLNLARLQHAHHTPRTPHEAVPSMTLALYQVPNPTECGLVEIDAAGRVVRFVEKPAAHQVFTNLANAGIMLCEPSIFDWIPVATPYDFGHDLLPKLLEAQQLLVGQEIAAEEYVIDIGTPAGYQRAQAVWAASTAAVLPTVLPL